MRPIILGVAGGNGSGKTTVMHAITRDLDDSAICVIHHDSNYRDPGQLDPATRSAITCG